MGEHTHDEVAYFTALALLAAGSFLVGALGLGLLLVLGWFYFGAGPFGIGPLIEVQHDLDGVMADAPQLSPAIFIMLLVAVGAAYFMGHRRASNDEDGPDEAEGGLILRLVVAVRVDASGPAVRRDGELYRTTRSCDGIRLGRILDSVSRCYGQLHPLIQTSDQT